MIFPKTPPLRFTHAKNWHIQYLAERLRPDEMAEYAAFFDGEDFDADLVARGFMNLPGDKFCVFGQDGQPAVVGGGQPNGRRLRARRHGSSAIFPRWRRASRYAPRLIAHAHASGTNVR
jgi:hypothetical protein